MRRALELARRGRVGTHPNPMVGAVLVRDGVVVGEGWHREYGGPHAEVAALAAAGDTARGATLYVTLEPCAHHGKTPPCTQAIIAADVSRVVFAAADPDSHAGGGAAVLRAAGVDVVEGVERDAARTLNAVFFRNHERGAPFISLKLAVSLDNRIAAQQGVRTPITGTEAQHETHTLRAAHDAILVGSGTARIDDPLLTVRGVAARTPPVRVIMDTDARLSPAARLVESLASAPVWLVCAEDADTARVRRLEDAGVRIVATPRDGRHLDLHAARRLLGEAGLRAILAEGGSALATALLHAGLVDRLYLWVAPMFLGSAGVPAFELDRPIAGWRLISAEPYGADLLLTLDPARAPVEFL
jgi:diaminohydroxyphosphoribosylaminopyrimidine deaminase / 5-amino-6-(5-phosphoribosylamino)uracil reductase